MVEIESYPGVTVSLLKGGVGKSTIALNVADRLAKHGNDVALIDLDLDGHMTTQLGYYDAFNATDNLGDILMGDLAPVDIMVDTGFGVDLIPSNQDMEAVQARVKEAQWADIMLYGNVMEPLVKDYGYDYVVIDNPGSRGKLSDNGLIATQSVIIPVIPKAGSINGLKKMMERQINKIRQQVDLDILAITPNMISDTMSQKKPGRRLVEQLNRNFSAFVPPYARIDETVFDALNNNELHGGDIPKPGIRKRNAIDDAFKDGKPLSEYDPNCDQIDVFDQLAALVAKSADRELKAETQKPAV